MKLQAFVKESVETSKAWETINRFDEQHVDIVKKAIAAVKGFPFISEEIVNPEDTHDGSGKIKLNFSDGLVDISVRVSTTEEDGGKIDFSFLMVAAKVNKKHMLDVEDNRPDITYFSEWKTPDSEFPEKLKGFKEAVDTFVDWYFDMSGTYGKIKLFKTHYNIIEGYHNSDKPRFVAVAGDFMCTNEVGGATPFKMEHRVL